MQIQKIKNNKDNTSFGSCKGIKCHVDFTERYDGHRKFTDMMKNSPIFKEFGKHYNYIAHFERDFAFSPNIWSSESFDFKVMYKLYLTPVHDIKMQLQSILKKMVNWFCGNKKQNTIITTGGKENISNLPAKFTVCYTDYLPSEELAYAKFERQLNNISIDTLNTKLKAANG